MVQRSKGPGVQGFHVVRALLLAVLATAVLPPVGAWWLNARRVDLTTNRAQGAAARAVAPADGRVLCGPGRLPSSSATGAGVAHADWLAIAVLDSGGGREADAWGQCLLVGSGWVLSAGANGMIETPLGAAVTNGDDIGAPLR